MQKKGDFVLREEENEGGERWSPEILVLTVKETKKANAWVITTPEKPKRNFRITEAYTSTICDGPDMSTAGTSLCVFCWICCWWKNKYLWYKRTMEKEEKEIEFHKERIHMHACSYWSQRVVAVAASPEVIDVTRGGFRRCRDKVKEDVFGTRGVLENRENGCHRAMKKQRNIDGGWVMWRFRLPGMTRPKIAS